MSPQEKLNKMVSRIYSLIDEATKCADQHKLSFSLDASRGSSYGAGLWYYGNPQDRSSSKDDGWWSSTESCM
jgi:hypothetical protein